MLHKFKPLTSIARMLQGSAHNLLGRWTRDVEGGGVAVDAPTASFVSTMHDAMYLSLFDGAFLRQ